MSVLDCVPMLIPLIATALTLQFYAILSATIPIPAGLGKPFLTVLIMYIVTYLYAKIFKCWNSNKWIFARAMVPILIFVAWMLAFIFPATAPFMNGIGHSPFLIALLSVIYKLAYDYIFESC